ncbi:MAG: hypothetical protein J7K04_11455 [Spirochaetales bacterium]|nr:hypothetical protein [Spirochaetales bacterium]
MSNNKLKVSWGLSGCGDISEKRPAQALKNAPAVNRRFFKSNFRKQGSGCDRRKGVLYLAHHGEGVPD